MMMMMMIMMNLKWYWMHKLVGTKLAPSCTLQEWVDTQNRSIRRRNRETSALLDNKIPTIQLVFSHYFDGADRSFNICTGPTVQYILCQIACVQNVAHTQ